MPPSHPEPSPEAAGTATDAAGTVTAADIDRMVDRLLSEGVDGARKRSAFWALLGLAAAIASAGMIADSTATVIGAMIVAPLMTPILGAAPIVLARGSGPAAPSATTGSSWQPPRWRCRGRSRRAGGS